LLATIASFATNRALGYTKDRSWHLRMATDLIRYDLLVQDALRSVVRRVLADTARSGLPGDHHFNIAFKTQAPGVVVPAGLKNRFPDEMSIILQHEFFELVVTPEAFEVTLNFSRKAERVTVPFDAITGFTDPSVPFGFKLEPRTPDEQAAAPAAATAPRSDAKPAATPAPAAKPDGTKPDAAKAGPSAGKAAAAPDKGAEAAGAAKVVSIDAFRKK
jgi:hypothetical protein